MDTASLNSYESLVDTPPPEESDAALELEEQQKELARNCMTSLVSLWRAHWVDPAGSDDEELISCAGQFVAYMPSVTSPLLKRLLILQRRVFTRLARALQSPNVDVAKEALAFTCCQFALVHFVGRDEVIYKAVTVALHNNVETNFDRALDFASK
ncbi:hypothetical protein PInf_004436 [Phytophthora infestans]|nr:hypothetical protein PInf_004436 [Phytophthora infestans]